MSTWQRSLTALAGAILFVTVWLDPGHRAAEAGRGRRARFSATIERDGGAPEESRAEQLADDPPHLRRLGLQPAQPDHAGQRRAAAAGVGRSRPARRSGHEAAPIVNNGVMFVSTPEQSGASRIDAKTGDVLWRYRRPRPAGRRSCCTDTSRGVALYGDKVFFAAGEAVLVALDAQTGTEVWTTTVADNKYGYYMTLAPLVADGKVMVGASGGELGVRGFVAAFDPETGKELWRTYTVPAPGEPGSETWPKGDQWKTGGAPVWVTGNYDPETNLAFWGTGNGGPWMGDQRPGDNLYIASTVAIDVATGQIKGHFQYNPNESWDWDEVSPPILVDYQRNGRTIKGLIDVARNGYLWFLERTRRPDQVRRGQAVREAERLPQPRSEDRPARRRSRAQAGHRQDAPSSVPSHWGGKNWPPIAFSPQTRMIYIPANDNLCGIDDRACRSRTRRAAASPARSRQSAVHRAGRRSHRRSAGVERRHRQARVDAHLSRQSPNWGSMLATGRRTGVQRRHQRSQVPRVRRRTGKLLWEFPTNSGIVAPPSSFTVDGKQYIAVQSGWGGDARGMKARSAAVSRQVAGGARGRGHLGVRVCRRAQASGLRGQAGIVKTRLDVPPLRPWIHRSGSYLRPRDTSIWPAASTWTAT